MKKKVKYELDNSHMPLYYFHDLSLEINGYKCQIDFLVITEYYIYVIECKNWNSDILVDKYGNFIKINNYSGEEKREAFKSPVTQNQKHIDVIKELRLSSKNKILAELVRKGFGYAYRPLIVFSNEKSILTIEDEELKDTVIRVDRLIDCIKRKNKDKKTYRMKSKEMKELADFFIENSKASNFEFRYKILEDEIEIIDIKDSFESTLLLEKELREYRNKKAQEIGAPIYFIFNNVSLKELIENKPKTREALDAVKGFSNYRLNNYGNDILNIIKEH